MLLGYARVSTREQSLDRQIDALLAAGVEVNRIYQDKVTGAKSNRPELNRLMDALRAGDTVIVHDLTRLGRTMKELLELMQRIRDAGAEVLSLKERFDTSTAAGRMMMAMAVILADFERDLLLERTREGIAAARARGRCGGRKPIDSRKVKAALVLYDSKKLTLREITEQTGVKRTTLYRYIDARKLDAQAVHGT